MHPKKWIIVGILVALLPFKGLKKLMKNKIILRKIMPKKIKIPNFGPPVPVGNILIAPKMRSVVIR